MQRRIIRSQSKKKRLLILVLLAIFLIALSILLFFPRLTKKALFISPVATNSSQDAKKIETLLLEADISFSSISFLDYYYIVMLSDGGQVILSLKKDIEKQITSLQPILKQLTIEGKKFNRIDFLFDKPLVVYE